MKKCMLTSKIHRAIITRTDLHYEGSILIDKDWMDEVGLLEFERVDVWNVTNGSRHTTYAIAGPAGTKAVEVNGAAAHLCNIGDIVIITAFGYVDFTYDEVMANLVSPKIKLIKEEK